MSKKLTKKQIEQLSQFTVDELLGVIHDLSEKYGEINQYLAMNYLMSPEEKLKNIEKRPLHKPATYSRHQSQTQLKTGIGVKR